MVEGERSVISLVEVVTSQAEALSSKSVSDGVFQFQSVVNWKNSNE